MHVAIRLKETSQPIEVADAENTYTKGPFFCVYRKNETVQKYPLADVFQVVEDYGKHAS